MYNGGYNNGGIDWEYFDNKKFAEINKKYLSPEGEGETKASQIVTAVNKLVYKWYNDGDVFDNTYYLKGWCNDLSSYANWLYQNTTNAVKLILRRISNAESHADYERILKLLADECLNQEFLSQFETEKVGTIYDCQGWFRFVDYEKVYNYNCQEIKKARCLYCDIG